MTTTTIHTSGRPGTTQVIPYSATPATSAAIGSQTRAIRLVSTTAAFVAIGDTTNLYLAPNFPEVWLTTPGQALTVAQVSAAGNLYLTEIE
jgi:hypothetical protein